jgi:hypothetical protein
MLNQVRSSFQTQEQLIRPRVVETITNHEPRSCSAIPDQM